MFIPFIRFQYTQRKQLTVQDARIKKKKKRNGRRVTCSKGLIAEEILHIRSAYDS